MWGDGPVGTFATHDAIKPQIPVRKKMIVTHIADGFIYCFEQLGCGFQTNMLFVNQAFLKDRIDARYVSIIREH
jgi:hypothetical protein